MMTTQGDRAGGRVAGGGSRQGGWHTYTNAKNLTTREGKGTPATSTPTPGSARVSHFVLDEGGKRGQGVDRKLGRLRTMSRDLTRDAELSNESNEDMQLKSKTAESTSSWADTAFESLAEIVGVHNFHSAVSPNECQSLPRTPPTTKDTSTQPVLVPLFLLVQKCGVSLCGRYPFVCPFEHGRGK